MERKWWVLRLLPRTPRRIDAARLEEALRERGASVNRRTIQRDLVELSTIFPISCSDGTKPYGWGWAEDPWTALPGMGDETTNRGGGESA
jgi:hypothetical protein